MNVKDFDSYWDVNGLLAPNPCDPSTVGSDNGPMFTSEYLIMAKRHGVDLVDVADPILVIKRCIVDGVLNREPGYSGQTGPDDYLGVLALVKEYELAPWARSFLWSMIKYYGFLNNENPGEQTKEAFLVRQLQLPCAMISAAFPSLTNPLHWLIRVSAFPLYVYTALVILVSCYKEPIDSTDPRRLSWLLIQTTKSVSLLCYLASIIWYRRLYRDYGPEGMRAVAAIYYSPKGLNNNPYSKYWVN